MQLLTLLYLFASLHGGAFPDQGMVYPLNGWEERRPGSLGIEATCLDSIADMLEGRGVIIYKGYLVKQWGEIQVRSDWMSSVKPLISTFLFMAIQEGRIAGVDEKIRNLGWELLPEDRDIQFSHLANMVSGYARPEAPGEAWAYNDYAIQLYQLSLFDRVFHESAQSVFDRTLGLLRFQDNPRFRKDKPRFYASVRDFARIGYFWMRGGTWQNTQVISSRLIENYMKPQVNPDLPHTATSETDDYLGIGTFGGGSDHFTKFGAGIYGYNWWFNGKGHLHPGSITWPDAPPDTFMSIGAGGNNMVMMPGLGILLTSAGGNWGTLEAGNPESQYNRILRLLKNACSYMPGK